MVPLIKTVIFNHSSITTYQHNIHPYLVQPSPKSMLQTKLFDTSVSNNFVKKSKRLKSKFVFTQVRQCRLLRGNTDNKLAYLTKLPKGIPAVFQVAKQKHFHYGSNWPQLFKPHRPPVLHSVCAARIHCCLKSDQ